MSEKIHSPFTPSFVLLDLAGMFFLGVGLARQFGNFEFFPQLAVLGCYGYPFIVIGVILMGLAIRQLIKNIKPGK